MRTKTSHHQGAGIRENLVFTLLALAGAVVMVYGLVSGPNFTDAYYHFNAAVRLAGGQGLTDEYLWIYIGAPDTLPAPSHIYWMPLTSLAAALGMIIAGAPGDYRAAQFPFALMLAAAAWVGYWLGGYLGGTRRQAWMAGILTLLGGFFGRFWGAADTFTPYALVGSFSLLCMGLAVNRSGLAQRSAFWLLAGVMAGLGHLTRADGLLLLLTGWAVILWPFYRSAESRSAMPTLAQRLAALVLVTGGYLLVMTPWFLRNLQVMGTPLPVGGTQAIWFTEYDDLFNYPPAATPQTLFADGLGLFLQSRWEALSNNLGTLIAVEGMIVLTPLMLLGFWRRRSEAFLRGFWIYALGLHLAMTLVFPFPGLRGGLFHSAAALLPWWMALGAAGLDDAVAWAAKRRRHWNPHVAQRIFSVAVVGFALLLTISVSRSNRADLDVPVLYTVLRELLPAGSRVMINDPARLYYYTGLGGTVLPNAGPEVIPQIARQYGLDYLVLEIVGEGEQAALAASEKLASILTAPPDFLTEITLNVPGVRLYAIDS